MPINLIAMLSTIFFLDMIGWAELDPNSSITPAVACKINTGIVKADEVKKTFVHAHM
jgi:hypothetical protein